MRRRRASSLRSSSEDPPLFRTEPVAAGIDLRLFTETIQREETPRRFRLAGVDIEVADVMDRWLAPDHRYFKVQDHQGDLYILRCDVASMCWELTFFRRRPREP